MAEADPAVVEQVSSGQGELAEAWRALRRLPEAGWIGLILPRFLLRLPYGKETASTERFDFEEMPDVPPEHQDYLERIPNGYTCHFVRPGWKLPARDKAKVGG